MVAPAPRKKLIEVSIPLEAINKESAREKSIRHGHPSTLHLWWARRPLAACRAVLFAQLVDDPSGCLEEFPTKAEQDAERDRLHKLIAALVPWEASNNETILNEARYEIARSVARGRGDKLPPSGEMKPKQIIDYLQKNAQPVYDPFCGGGSIPLEAQRLGLKAMGSDLNPVAALISKALVEFPPKFAGRRPVNPEVNELHQWKGAQGLADDVRYYGGWIREQAEKKIGHLYPNVTLKDGKEATAVAWLWVRTVPSPDPRAGGAHVPLASSLVLSSKKAIIVKIEKDAASPDGWRSVVKSKGVSDAELEEASSGTKLSKGTFRCVLSRTPMDEDYLRKQISRDPGRYRVVALVVNAGSGKIYLTPSQASTQSVQFGREDWQPPQEMYAGALGFRLHSYGVHAWNDFFHPRQVRALDTFASLIPEAAAKIAEDAGKIEFSKEAAHNYAAATCAYLACALGRAADYWNRNTMWEPGGEFIAHAFTEMTIPVVWDCAEANPFASGGGGWGKTCIDWVARVLNELPAAGYGSIVRLPAQDMQPPNDTTFFTDPPYYDNIGYADLSDCFYIWHQRALSSIFPDDYRLLQTPKDTELVATAGRHGGPVGARDFFLQGMSQTLKRALRASGSVPMTLYYAYKEKGRIGEGRGWESFLQAVIDAGWQIDASWPLRTERQVRHRGQGKNSLASSIVLVCRPREEEARDARRDEFIRSLRRDLQTALANFTNAGVPVIDLGQALVGPGLEVYSKFRSVANSDGRRIQVAEALRIIAQVRSELSDGTMEYDGETRFALDWFAAKGFDRGQSSDAITMCNAVNGSLDDMVAAGFFAARGGVARLLKREELSDNWDPAKDNRVTVWEACQHLTKRLRAEDGGIDAAAALYNLLGSRAEPAHALARRLYDICEQNQWAAEGYVYNQLHQEWAAIEKRAAALAEAGQPQDLFSR